MDGASSFAGQAVALLTQHGKERVIAPVLEPVLGCKITLVSGFDTDLLGTFTRDIPRPGTQLDAARRKARKGMELSGLPIGLASEGSFAADPFAGMFPWNVEMLVWIDDTRGIEVVGMAQGAARSGHLQSAEWAQVKAFAEAEDFPTHHLVLRPDGPDDPRIHKGIADWEQLKAAFDACQAEAAQGQVVVEADLRAFANPTRMQMIERAAHDLKQRLASCCPQCHAPGYWITERQKGLPCAACRLPTSDYRNEVWKCVRCQHQTTHPRSDRQTADPRHCAYCNP